MANGCNCSAPNFCSVHKNAQIARIDLTQAGATPDAAREWRPCCGLNPQTFTCGIDLGNASLSLGQLRSRKGLGRRLFTADGAA